MFREATRDRLVDIFDLAGVLRRAATLTFEQAGVVTTSSTRPPSTWSEWEGPVAFIGLGGTGIQGALAVGTSWQLLEKSIPDASRSESDWLDWSRELSNLLLGAVKVSLVKRGISTSMGLPVSVTGLEVATSVGGTEGVTELLDSPHGIVMVSLALIVDCTRLVGLSAPALASSSYDLPP